MKKKIHTLSLLFIVFALGQNEILASRPNPLSSTSGFSDEDGNKSSRPQNFNTSPFGRACENLTNEQDWSQYGDTKSPGIVWNFAHINTDVKEGTAIKLDSEEKIKETRDIANSYQVCQAFLFATDPSTYDGSKEQDQSFSSMATGGISCLNLPTKEEQEECLASAEEESTCKSNGYETHDFKACVSLLKFADGFFIAKKGLQQVQGVVSQVNAMDSQSKVNAEINKGNDATVATLGAQKDSLSQQSNMAVQQGALDGAKAATLWAKINAFPTFEKLKKKCMTEYENNESVNAILQEKVNEKLRDMGESVPTVDFTGEFSAERICSMAIKSSPDLLMNQDILDRMRALALQSAVESAANLAKGALLNKMAGEVDDTIKDIETFEPPEFQEFDGVLPPKISECIVDPTIEGCPPTGSPAYQGFAGQGFSSSVGGAASLGNQQLTLDDDEIGNSAAAGGNNDVIPSRFGSATGTIDKNNDFSEGTVAAGTIKSVGSPAGGGGGAGGGGSASPPGKAPQTGAQADNSPAAPGSVAIKTKGEGLGRVGGRGRFGSKKSKTKNPFSKLLSKNKPKNGVLNFRGPAQIGKGGSIFKMISKRYSSVNAKKRLLQYKQK